MSIYKFYNNEGWKKKNKTYKDAELFEDLRYYAKKYVSNCRNRIFNFIPRNGTHLLDFASGPIQYKEYLKYSKNFKVRHCVDFSKDAIKQAKKKIRNKGKYYCNDFFKLNFKKNFFDCCISLHTIYHIKKNSQKKAVAKLLNITKKKSPVIILYSNPETLVSRLSKIFKLKRKKEHSIYFYCHPIKWWNQFKNTATIEMYPWRSFSSGHQKIIFPNNVIGKIIFDFIFKLENLFGNFFINNFQYYIIVLRKI